MGSAAISVGLIYVSLSFGTGGYLILQDGYESLQPLFHEGK
jgi:hypothetical protein